MTTHKKSVRLPLHITPLHYNLTLKPDLEVFVFTGIEVIKIKINKNSKSITLHSKDIDIEKVEIENKKNK